MHEAGATDDETNPIINKTRSSAAGTEDAQQKGTATPVVSITVDKFGA